MVQEMLVSFAETGLQCLPQTLIVEVRRGLLGHTVDASRGLHYVIHRLGDRASPRSKQTITHVLKEACLSNPWLTFDDPWISLFPIVFQDC